MKQNAVTQVKIMEFEDMLKRFSVSGDTSGAVQMATCLPPPADPPLEIHPPVDPAPSVDSVSRIDDLPAKRIRPGNDVHIRVRKTLRVSLEELPAEIVRDVVRRLTFTNPLWIQAKRSGRNRSEITRHLTCYWIHDGFLNMTRGFAGTFVRILQAHHLEGIYDDFTVRPDPVDFRFKRELYAYEKEAVEQSKGRRFGIIQGQTGSGKKMISLYLAASRKLPVLVIIRTKARLYKWQDTISRFLGLSSDRVGIVGDGRLELGRPITLALTRTLPRVLEEVAEATGFLVIDTCSNANLNVFFKFVRYIPSAYMLGLAESGKRQDKLTKLMHAYIGPVLHSIDSNRVFLESTMARPVLSVQETPFDYDYKDDWKAMVGALSIDPERNRMISSDVLAATAMNRDTCAAVMVERLVHLEALKSLFDAGHRDCALLSGTTKKAEIKKITESVNKGKIQIVCATSKSFPLLDLDRVTHLFIAAPVRGRQTLCEAVGKLFWAKIGDDPPKILEYQDKPELLRGSLRGRMRIYREMGVAVNQGL